MRYDVFWRGKTTQKMNKLRNATKEQVLTAIDALLDTQKIIKFKVTANG